MFLRLPAMNRSLNRENPYILIMMIAGKQIIRGVEEDKRDQRESQDMGPVKPATQMSATAPNTDVFTLLLHLPLFSASLPFPLNLWLFFVFPFVSNIPTSFFILFSTLTHFFPFHALLLQLLVFNVQH
ncbi:hypothetical protein V8G54_006598 [Vigna mungo]|uniref:Uncharacterized protein n=1 Tax=Vigna mungo TaxID=3915 RepID=A0AAQ3S850_VIGMU